MKSKQTFQVKRPTGLVFVGYLMMLTSLLSYVALRGFWPAASTEIMYILSALSLCSVLFFVISLKRILQKPSEVKLTTESITINGREIMLSKIEEIIVQGYWKPVIGIRVKGSSVIPSTLCYRFMEQEEKGMQALQKWAQVNGITLMNRPFVRGI